jgi:GT2 family glycosyltransferase
MIPTQNTSLLKRHQPKVEFLINMMKTRTAAVILNHNLPDYTDMLYESLKPYERDDYDLMVFDNGSSVEGKSKYTSYGTDQNIFFGGGFNAAMQMVLEDDRYDSLLFLNNDLTVHPYNFVSVLREEMFTDHYYFDLPLQGVDGFDIVSPCFYNVEAMGQCHWKTMHCWGNKETRIVPFIDFQCPLISKRLLKEVKEINPLLQFGWGIDCMFAIKCKELGWKMGVVDRLSVLHHNSLTVKKGVAGINMQEYCQQAEQGQRKFFAKEGLIDEFNSVRQLGEKYLAQ